MWALGTALNADIFENANSIPNALYVLVAGGVVNVVLVPQLVKNIAASNDDGAAFTSRVFTLAFSVLALGTVVALALVPLLVRLLFRVDDPAARLRGPTSRGRATHVPDRASGVPLRGLRAGGAGAERP
ncbi:MAG: hypothetical protein PGN07_10400 [Aeromicrobium erythreum]